MKIGILSDLHIAYDTARQLSFYKEKAIMHVIDEVDALVLCGDNAEPNSDLRNQRRIFDAMRNKSNIPIAFITGNHDLFGNVLRRSISIGEMRKQFDKYSVLAQEYGIIHLEDENAIIGDTIISGTYGHYDGTLSGILMQENNNTVRSLVDGLERRGAGTRLLVMHCVPTKKMIGRPDGPQQDLYTPFAGASALEHVIRTLKPTWHFCGHTHAYAHHKIGNTLSYNVGTDYANFFYFIVDTNNSSVNRREIVLGT